MAIACLSGVALHWLGKWCDFDGPWWAWSILSVAVLMLLAQHYGDVASAERQSEEFERIRDQIEEAARAYRYRPPKP